MLRKSGTVNAHTNDLRLLWKNAYGRPPTKGVDTGPSCKELGFFLKIQLFHIWFIYV